METSIPRLSRARRRELIRLGRKTKDPATSLRFLMIARLATGLSRRVVAAQLGAAVSTVAMAVRRYLESGIPGLYDRRKNNGAPKADEPFRCYVLALLHWTPLDYGWQRPTWTRELLCLEMERRGFPRVAPCTMGRVLATIGARRGRPKPIVLCPWRRQRRLRRLRELRRLAANATAKEPVFFADEVDIHLNPHIGVDWMPPGLQRRVVTPGKNEKRYIAGALNASTRKLTWVEGNRKNSALFCSLVWRLLVDYRRARRIHIILDNYIIHSSKITQKYLAQFGDKVVLHFLPPYCPDANRIERVWLDVHANVTRNHRCRTIQELMVNVGSFLLTFNQRSRRNPTYCRRAARAA
jgi:transposase